MSINTKYLSKRTMAYMIDCIVVFSFTMLFLQWFILSPIRGYLGINELWFHNSINMQLYVLLTISLPVWLYFTIFDSYKSQGTLGKRLMKLRVLNQNTHTGLSIRKSFIRSVAKLLPWEIAHSGVIFPVPLYYAENPDVRVFSVLGLVLFIVYFFSIVFSKKSQSLYDKSLGVIVVNN